MSIGTLLEVDGMQTRVFYIRETRNFIIQNEETENKIEKKSLFICFVKMKIDIFTFNYIF